MTRRCWDWLPDTALISDQTSAAIDAELSAWSQKWFADFALERQRLEPSSPVGPVFGTWSGIQVQITERTRTRLTGLALDVTLERLELSDDDQAAVDALSSEMLRTLADSLAEALSGGAALADDDKGGVLNLQLCDSAGDRLVTLALPRALIATARRRALPPRRMKRQARLVSFRLALKSQPVRLEARLGQVSLSLGDTRSLSTGDVVVVSRPLDEPFDVVLGDTGRVIACAALVDAASPRSISLQPPRSLA